MTLSRMMLLGVIAGCNCDVDSLNSPSDRPGVSDEIKPECIIGTSSCPMTSCQNQCFQTFDEEILCCELIDRLDDRAACAAHANGLAAGIGRCIVDESNPDLYTVSNTLFECEGGVIGGETALVNPTTLVVVDTNIWRRTCF